MNSSVRRDSTNDAVLKNLFSFSLSVIINSINGAFVYVYFKSETFYKDARYVLYIHLVITDMIMLSLSVTLQILTYTISLSLGPCCLIILILVTANKISPLNLAGMAMERYIAVCWPLQHVQTCTAQRAHALIALLWLVSLVPALSDIVILYLVGPPVLPRGFACYPIFLYQTWYHKAKRLTVQVLMFSFVFLTIIITYLRVMYVAHCVSGSQKSSARSARNTIMLHGAQLLLCLVSFLAPFINSALISIWPESQTNTFFITFLFLTVLPRLLSPLIYGVRDKKFNSLLRRHFHCLCCGSAGGKSGQVDGVKTRKKSRKTLG